MLAVRAATIADLDSLNALWHELERAQGSFRVFPVAANGEERVMRSFSEAIRSRDGDVLVAVDGDEPVGMALVRVERPSRMSDVEVVELSRVVVRDGRRGAGIGRSLVDAAHAWARAHGVANLMAGIFVANESSRRFWTTAGFEPWVERLIKPVD